MGIEDFLVFYPSPLSENVNEILYKKKEFYDNKLLKLDDPEKSSEYERDILKWQEVNARFSSVLTNFDKRLIYHRMGLGKTTTAIEAIELMYEQCKYLNMKPKKVLILLSNDNLIKKFVAEIIKRHPEKYPITDDTSEIMKKKMVTKKYMFSTYTTFAKNDLKEDFAKMVEKFSYSMVVCDEIHGLTGMRAQSESEYANVYASIHKFLHSIKSSKILVMSGTPMRDTVSEIASVMNLLLDDESQLPENNFEQLYFDRDNILKSDKALELSNLFKNKISFLISPTNVPYEFITNKLEYNSTVFKFIKLYYDQMSKFQTKHYIRNKESEDKSGFRKGEQYASSFIFPDGSTGNAGFNKYIIKKEKIVRDLQKKGKSKIEEYFLSDELKQELRPSKDTPISERIQNLKKFSCKFASAIEQILKPESINDVCFWFSEFVHETGTILFATILKDIFDFIPANGNKYSKDDPNRKFTYSLVTSKNLGKNIKWLNSDNNVNAEVVKVIIGSKLISTGYDMMNIKQVHLDTAHWNYSQTDQTISRALRFNGNNKLIEVGIDPTVKIYLHTAILNTSDNIEGSVDLDMYQTCEKKDYKIKQIERIAKEVSIDCALNYDVNFNENAKDGSRECDYTVCKYKCNGIDSLNIDKSELLLDSYRLLYQQPVINLQSEYFKSDLISSQSLNVETIGDNMYVNTKILYTIQDESQIMTSRLGTKCFINSNNSDIFLSNVTNTDNITSWYSTFPMISYRKSLSDILHSLNIVSDYITENLESIKDADSLDAITQIVDRLPSWVYENILKSVFLTLTKHLIENEKDWTRSNLLNLDDVDPTILNIAIAFQSKISIYPNLILLNINDIIWKLKYIETDYDVNTFNWAIQTGKITDTILTEFENKYKSRAIKHNIDFIGKIKGNDMSTFKLIESNVKQSRGRDCSTLQIFNFIYFIVKFEIEYEDENPPSSEVIKRIMSTNKHIAQFDTKFKEMSSDNWDKSTKRNVVWWLTADDNRKRLCRKIKNILKQEKLLIII